MRGRRSEGSEEISGYRPIEQEKLAIIQWVKENLGVWSKINVYWNQLVKLAQLLDKRQGGATQPSSFTKLAAEGLPNNVAKGGTTSSNPESITIENGLLNNKKFCFRSKSSTETALPGRTDNNIKNYFYSTLRKALRKVNAYVLAHKKEQRYRNVKEFKPQNLSKILSVAESKYQQKINLKSFRVIHDAKNIKQMLVTIQLDYKMHPLEERCLILEETVDQILQFNRNCKRRKGKKKDEQHEEQGGLAQNLKLSHNLYQEEKSVEDQRFHNPKQVSRKKEKKGTKNEQKIEQNAQKLPITKQEEEEQYVDFIDQLIVPMNEAKFQQNPKQKEMGESGKISGDSGKIGADREIGRSSSSGNNLSRIFEMSSSLNRLPANGMINECSHQYAQTKGLDFLDLMPVYDCRRPEEEVNVTIFQEQNVGNDQGLPFLDQSRGFNPFQQDNIGVEGYLQAKKKTASRYSLSHEMEQIQ